MGLLVLIEEGYINEGVTWNQNTAWWALNNEVCALKWLPLNWELFFFFSGQSEEDPDKV